MQSPLACPYGATASRNGLLGLQPCWLPLPVLPVLTAVLPFGFAQIGVLGLQPHFVCLPLPVLANLATPSGRCQLISYAVVIPSRQKPAKLVVMRRSLHSVVPFQQIIASQHKALRGSCLLTPINCFHFTPSLRSLGLWWIHCLYCPPP